MESEEIHMSIIVFVLLTVIVQVSRVGEKARQVVGGMDKCTHT